MSGLEGLHVYIHHLKLFLANSKSPLPRLPSMCMVLGHSHGHGHGHGHGHEGGRGHEHDEGVEERLIEEDSEDKQVRVHARVVRNPPVSSHVEQQGVECDGTIPFSWSIT